MVHPIRRMQHLLEDSLTIIPRTRVGTESIGTLRSDNGDVHENVAEKQTSHHFKLFRDYPNSPCYLKEGDFGKS